MTTTTPPTSNIEMNRSSSRSRQNSDTLDNIPTTSNSLPTSPRLDESNRESASREPSREPVNFWSEPRSVVLQRNPNETFGNML